MRRRTGIGGLVLLAALAAHAGEPAAPLQDSRKELKALGKDQPAAAGEGAVEKLRGAMPQMQLPAAEARPLDPRAAEKAEKELKKKKAAEKNWLVNGMERLDRNDKSAARRTGEDLAETPKEDGRPDPADPEYILKVYSEQQKGADARSDRKPAVAPRDPLKPFLQGWLADSPARGKFFDDYARKPDTAVGYAGPTAPAAQNPAPGPAGFDAGGTALKGDRAGALPVQPNPYLQGVDMTFLHDSGPVRTPATAAAPAFQPAPPPPAASTGGPMPAARETTKKSPPSTREDDKKYFPQLKRF